MATKSVATKNFSMDELGCRIEQISGVLATIAQSEASHEEIRNAVWGALALTYRAQEMVDGERFGEKS